MGYIEDFNESNARAVAESERRRRRGMIVQRFANVGEYLDFVQSPTDMPMRARSSHEAEAGWWTLGWYGGVSWDEAIHLAEHGWPEGVEKVERFTSRLNTVLAGMIKVPEVAYGVKGLKLDMGRYANGNPNSVMRIVDSAIRIDARPPRIVRLVINTCVSSAVGADQLIWRGAAIAALALMLERHGTRVEIDLNGSNRAGPGLETWVRVKESDFPLNMPYLVYLLAHPSSFRRLMFSAWEHIDEYNRNLIGIRSGGGYGYVGETVDTGDIYLSGFESRVAVSEDTTLAWIKLQLEKQGIEVNAE